jgi:hypothetical protein
MSVDLTSLFNEDLLEQYGHRLIGILLPKKQRSEDNAYEKDSFILFHLWHNSGIYRN